MTTTSQDQLSVAGIPQGIIVFAAFVVCAILVSVSVQAQQLDLADAINRIDIGHLRSQQEQLESNEQGHEQSTQLALIYGFFADYYTYIEEDRRKAGNYSDLTIKAAEAALEGGESSVLYSLIADAYSKKLTGLLTAIRFGSRVANAIEQAEALDADGEALLYVQAKRYLLAPTLFGGDPEKAVESFERLVERNPDSSMYHAFLAESYRADNPKQARMMFTKAVEISANNAWAKRELQSE